ncbi:MAG: 4'-phosphopantetheinyl transferase superfamily protein [Prevotellaceae bacterium]|nr:4'-phosphopantetheinyl transferase superfamily protein [Prevotellaceae bacterium]
MILLPSLPNSKLYVSQIIDNLPDLAQIFGTDTETFVNYAQRSFKSSHRQHEWLTIRAMLRQALSSDVTIAYDSEGCPSLSGQDIIYKGVSISHSKTYAVLLLSKQPNVGVDVEQISPRILKLAHRIAQPIELPNRFSSMTDTEQIQYITTLWTIKEAAYKSLPHQQGVDLLTDILIAPFNLYDTPFSVTIDTKMTVAPLQAYCQQFYDSIVSVVTLL